MNEERAAAAFELMGVIDGRVRIAVHSLDKRETQVFEISAEAARQFCADLARALK